MPDRWKISFGLNRLSSTQWNKQRASSDRRPGQGMALREKSIGIARLAARLFPNPMTGIIGQEQEAAGAIANVLRGALGGEEAKYFGGVTALKIRPGTVGERNEIRHCIGVDAEPTVHVDSACPQYGIVGGPNRRGEHIGVHADDAGRAIQFAQAVACRGRKADKYFGFVRREAELPLEQAQNFAAGRRDGGCHRATHVIGERRPRSWAAFKRERKIVVVGWHFTLRMHQSLRSMLECVPSCQLSKAPNRWVTSTPSSLSGSTIASISRNSFPGYDAWRMPLPTGAFAATQPEYMACMLSKKGDPVSSESSIPAKRRPMN